MPGLSEKEKAGCAEILQSMEVTDLLALKDTVTSRMVEVENVQEAIQAILSYSSNAEELLKRKKVHRDLIFMYLARQGCVVPPSSEKHQLISRTLQHWASHRVVIQEAEGSVQHESRQFTNSNSNQEISHSIDYQSLGEQFCQWFYKLLNSQNPLLGQPAQEWGPQHFWDDAKLKFCYTIAEQKLEEYAGAELVSLRLKALVKDEQLFLHPNLERTGMKCVSSPHGLVVVAVAGTIHRNSVCLGIFEQVFGLIRAPHGNNNWKVKFVNLNIRGQDVIEEGRTSRMLPVLTLNNQELQRFYS
ncbi:uncharacterized protein C3orf38 homolog [Erpetoichthys calabaricus]|uniref:Chromosome 3 open reading frame 38 n=1 Tax=Erpetoichthys calabaricus TaxID=27687 RepID=A0A8C4RMR0_ERPCA|nr:uncharacterized protein C3orf38 homolog [Erpetoichthys calabaricus]